MVSQSFPTLRGVADAALKLEQDIARSKEAATKANQASEKEITSGPSQRCRVQRQQCREHNSLEEHKSRRTQEHVLIVARLVILRGTAQSLVKEDRVGMGAEVQLRDADKDNISSELHSPISTSNN